jgi:hypothetical protein
MNAQNGRHLVLVFPRIGKELRGTKNGSNYRRNQVENAHHEEDHPDGGLKVLVGPQVARFE